MNRRDFSRLIGLGLAGAATPVGARSLLGLPGADFDAAIEGVAKLSTEADERLAKASQDRQVLTHWRAAQNNTWRWFEKSEFIARKWRLTGMTLPVNRQTGHRISGRDCADYLVDSQVPAAVIDAATAGSIGVCVVEKGAAAGPQATAERRAADGRPASLWLSNLDCDQLHLWLASFKPPEAGVSGMTYFEHLTRDHGFQASAIACLTEAEQAKLHGATHYGY